MPVPKKRVSRSQRDQRRAHDALKLTAAIESCPKCGEVKQRHRVCPSCGSYRGVQVFADVDAAETDAPPPAE